MTLTPMRAIRAKCVDCCCGNMAEVRRCPAEKCALHPYRMGHRPKEYTDTPGGTNKLDTTENLHIPTEESKKESPLT